MYETIIQPTIEFRVSQSDLKTIALVAKDCNYMGLYQQARQLYDHRARKYNAQASMPRNKNLFEKFIDAIWPEDKLIISAEYFDEHTILDCNEDFIYNFSKSKKEEYLKEAIKLNNARYGWNLRLE